MLGLDTGTVTDMEKFWAGKPGCGREDEEQQDTTVSIDCVCRNGTLEKILSYSSLLVFIKVNSVSF